MAGHPRVPVHRSLVRKSSMRTRGPRTGTAVGLLPMLTLVLLLLGGASPASAAELILPDAGAGAGASTNVPITVDDASGMLGTDIVVMYDPAVAAATSVSTTSLSSAQVLTTNLGPAGVIRISLYGTAPLSGAGPLLDIDFTSTGPPGSHTQLAFTSVDLNEGGLPALFTDGSYCVQGLPAPITGMQVARVPATTRVTLAWDAHQVAESYNLYRGGQQNLGDLACFATGISGTSIQDDGAMPALGGCFFYLVTAATCAGDSSPGFSSSGVQRILPSACP